MSRVCSNCGGSDIDFDQARGDAVCMNCGSVLEDNIIVSEVQFQENSIGGSSAIGQFVSSEGNKTGIAPGFRHGLGKESRAVTLENGKKRINHVGNQLQMNQHCIDTAYNFYKLAVNKRLTRGRRTNHVVAACLYLVCRTERTPHMLLDFSDILNIDVFTLGRAYMKLAQELYINLPALDPCLYIHRFAHKLEFGDKEHDVAMTALRLVSRMKRDWIHHGRRPSGLCGAAILVAARLHSFSRTVREVVKVVRISDTTIRKRLGEFKDTPSSQLTVDEFQKIDLEEEQDPPSFTQAKKRTKQQTEDLNNPEIANELLQFQEEIENLLQKSTAEKPDTPPTQQPPTTAAGEDTTTVPVLPVVFPVTAEEQVAEIVAAHAEQPPLAVEKNAVADAGGSGDANNGKGGELDLSGLDDDELDKCLLTENEVEVKTKLWMEENRDYLEMLKEKEAREAKEREEGANKEPKKKRKPYKKKQNVPASTAGEAIEKMLVEKKISSKINYEVLRGLETSEAPKPAEFASMSAAPASTESNVEHEFLVPRVPTRRGGRKRESAVAVAAAAPSQSLLGVKKRKEEHEVVIESGPVEYERNDHTNIHEDEHTEEDAEDDEDELQNVSAAQLMGHIYNEGLEDDYGDFEEDF